MITEANAEIPPEATTVPPDEMVDALGVKAIEAVLVVTSLLFAS